MFSCCRANPEKAASGKIKKDKKDKHKQINSEQETATTTTGNNDKKLIIPTITIENGKATNETEDESTMRTPESGVGGSVDSIKDCEIKAECQEQQVEAALNQKTSNVTAERKPQAADTTTDINKEVKTTVVVEKKLEDSDNAVADISAAVTVDDANVSLNTTTNTNASAKTSNAATNITTNTTTTIDNQKDLPTKSCISRHNSTHASIKKKVNISNFAEIIEPEPLPPPPPPYDQQAASPSYGEDDDVFSDSLPPPKRESMCAPYIERDGDDDEMPPETLAFAHGLPEWFNDERINDFGCIEPPVTPVGRDELELKRQRLYADLLRAAHAAVEHSVRFNPLGPEVLTYNATTAVVAADTDEGEEIENYDEEDCDPDLKPSVAENLENLVNRLEKLVERLERSVSARELEIANRTFDSVLEKKRESFDLETTDLPPLPEDDLTLPEPLTQRIERIETTLNKLNDSYSSHSQSSQQQQKQQQAPPPTDGSLENIPTVLEDYQEFPPPPPLPLPEETTEALDDNMSVLGYQDIVTGPLCQYLALSSKIGGDVATQANLVKSAFDAQMQYVTMATQCAKPSQQNQMDLLKPTSTQISAIQDYREKNRASPYFNHLSAISESIPALGWVCVAPTPGPHVKEMNDAGQFYTNRVLKEWKEKDTTHVEWARAWIQTLTELQQFIKQHHTTGLVWSGKGGVPAGGAAPPPPPMGACPPPPPPPAFDLAGLSLEGDERSALFAEINKGADITKSLKKVTADMQTHKNPTLRTGPAPFKSPTQFGSAVGGVAKAAPPKEPVFMRDGKKWMIEYQKNNTGLLVDEAEMNNVVYVFKCEGSTLTVKGKVNNIVLDSCKKCSLVFDSVVASIEFVNCQSVQMQVMGFVPTVSIDKTDGCQMFLSNESLGVEIVSSKSSEMNVMLPTASGDYTELALPEQFKTTISGKTLKTVCVDSLG